MRAAACLSFILLLAFVWSAVVLYDCGVFRGLSFWGDIDRARSMWGVNNPIRPPKLFPIRWVRVYLHNLSRHFLSHQQSHLALCTAKLPWELPETNRGINVRGAGTGVAERANEPARRAALSLRPCRISSSRRLFRSSSSWSRFEPISWMRLRKSLTSSASEAIESLLSLSDG